MSRYSLHFPPSHLGWTCGAGSSGRDALLRDPALHVSTPFSVLPCESAHGPEAVSLFYLHWMREPGSRGSASLPRAFVLLRLLGVRRRIAREPELAHLVSVICGICGLPSYLRFLGLNYPGAKEIQAGSLCC